MANFVYTADDLFTVVASAPNANLVTRSFIATPATFFPQNAGIVTGLGIGDIILLAPIPGNAVLVDFRVSIPSMDTGSAVRYSVGDNVILSGATNILSGTTAQTSQTTNGGTFTLTAAASTSSFTSTNAFLMVNGIVIAYAALSGSTFTGCNSMIQNQQIPGSTLIQQMGNTGVYAASVVPSGSNNACTIHPDFTVSATAVTTSTNTPSALPARYAAPFNTQFPAGLTNAAFTVPAQIGQRYFCLTVPTGPTTFTEPTIPLTGYISYYLTGYVV